MYARARLDGGRIVVDQGGPAVRRLDPAAVRAARTSGTWLEPVSPDDLAAALRPEALVLVCRPEARTSEASRMVFAAVRPGTIVLFVEPPSPPKPAPQAQLFNFWLGFFR